MLSMRQTPQGGRLTSCAESTGWRDTLHTLYQDRAEEIVECVLGNTGLTIPDSSGFLRQTA